LVIPERIAGARMVPSRRGHRSHPLTWKATGRLQTLRHIRRYAPHEIALLVRIVLEVFRTRSGQRGTRNPWMGAACGPDLADSATTKACRVSGKMKVPTRANGGSSSSVSVLVGLGTSIANDRGPRPRRLCLPCRWTCRSLRSTAQPSISAAHLRRRARQTIYHFRSRSPCRRGLQAVDARALGPARKHHPGIRQLRGLRQPASIRRLHQCRDRVQPQDRLPPSHPNPPLRASSRRHSRHGHRPRHMANTFLLYRSLRH